MNPDVLADNFALAEAIREMEDEIIFEAFYDTTKGKRNWRAVCLTQADTADIKRINSLDGTRLPIKLKILDTFENIIPDPCDLILTENQVRQCVSMSPTAYSDQPFESRYKLPSFGDVVRIKFDEKGPPELGRHRGIKYEFSTDETDRRYDCKSRKFLGGITSLTKNGKPMGSFERTPMPNECKESLPAKARGRIKLSWTELGVMRPYFGTIMSLIASGESKRSGYEAVNRGTKGRGANRVFLSGYGYKPIDHFGKNLVDMTVNEVRCTQKYVNTTPPTPSRKGKCPDIPKYSENNLHYLAVGKYQLIPQTLHGAIKSLKGPDFDPDVQLYDGPAQERFGLYTILVKRPKFANYIIDNHDNACEAAQALALEYASIALQYKFRNQERGQPSTTGNVASKSPEEAYEVVKKTKKDLQNDAALMRMLKKYKK